MRWHVIPILCLILALVTVIDIYETGEDIVRLQPRLPEEYIDWFSKPVQRFFRIESAASIILIACVLIALIVSNTKWASSYLLFWNIPINISVGANHLSGSLHAFINDGAMTLFFFLIALELKREFVIGELRQLKVAALPISAALGGMIIPIFIYLIFMFGHPGQNGWGTVMATDTALAIGCLALFGKNQPKSLRIFMLSLAVIDDIGAILVIGIGYTHGINWYMLGLAFLGFIIIGMLQYLGIRNLLVFFFSGIVVWFLVEQSGIHATIVGVVLGFITPTKKWVDDSLLRTILEHVVGYSPGDHWSGDTEGRNALQIAVVAAREALSPLERLEIILHPWVSYLIVPLFVLANAGITITANNLCSRVTLAIILGFVLGKPIGVFSFSWIAVRMRIAIRPTGLTWSLLAAGSLLAGIGFTMALFMAELSFAGDVLSNAKVGILVGSLICGSIGLLILALIKTKVKVAV